MDTKILFVTFGLAAAGGLNLAHAQKTVTLHPGGTATPPSLGIKKGDKVKTIQFKKDGNKPFTLTFVQASPCLEGMTLTSTGSPVACTLPPQGVCENGNPVLSNMHCTFRFSTGVGDPDVTIDQGYNPPPPKKKKDKTPKK